ncbi:MAG: RecQ family ATP-dependent DNA helicase [Crocinitomicaceae bacterium]
MNEKLDILNRYWGYEKFRSQQEEIIDLALAQKDCLALLPTGGGKSICYQIPGTIQDGVCLVISPLIALMEDQVNQLKKRNINAAAITSAMSKRQIDITLDNAIYGELKFLYVSPERLKTRIFRTRFEKMKVNLIAVDEAHCISEWGYDFRPAYLEIREIRELQPKAPIMALTATATEEVLIDIKDKLGLKEDHLIRKSFERKNLTYSAQETDNKMNRILHFLQRNEGSGIIYCGTRRAVKEIASKLLNEGFNVDFYHAGLSHDERKQKQSDWTLGKTRIIVSTNAFGMGINKPDVRFVLHYDIPRSPEAYFQEAGRAGRDGKPAKAQLFFEPKDITELESSIETQFPPLPLIKRIYDALGNHLQLAIGAGKDTSYPIDLAEFAEKYNQRLPIVYNSLKFLELCNFIELSTNYKKPSQLKILIDNKELYSYQIKDKTLNKLLLFLLRTEMGIFDQYVQINEYKISQKTGLTRKDVVQKLKFLNLSEAIDYIPQNESPTVTYKTERLSPTHFSIDPKIYHTRKVVAHEKIRAMLKFVTGHQCFSQYLLEYFDEEEVKTCGKCQYCLRKESTKNRQLLIHEMLNWCNKNRKETPLKLDALFNALAIYSEDEIMDVLRELTSEGILLIDLRERLITNIK